MQQEQQTDLLPVIAVQSMYCSLVIVGLKMQETRINIHPARLQLVVPGGLLALRMTKRRREWKRLSANKKLLKFMSKRLGTTEQELDERLQGYDGKVFANARVAWKEEPARGDDLIVQRAAECRMWRSFASWRESSWESKCKTWAKSTMTAKSIYFLDKGLEIYFNATRKNYAHCSPSSATNTMKPEVLQKLQTKQRWSDYGFHPVCVCASACVLGGANYMLLQRPCREKEFAEGVTAFMHHMRKDPRCFDARNVRHMENMLMTGVRCTWMCIDIGTPRRFGQSIDSILTSS